MSDLPTSVLVQRMVSASRTTILAWPSWAVLSVGLSLASLVVLYAATRIVIPPLGCTIPQPPVKQAAFDSSLAAIASVTHVANRLALASVAVVITGIVAARVWLPVFCLLAALIVVALLVVGYGHDVPMGWCADN